MTAAESDVPTESDAPKGQAGPARQTTAYLKKLFAQVGFTIDARRGQNFLVDLNLIWPWNTNFGEQWCCKKKYILFDVPRIQNRY